MRCHKGIVYLGHKFDDFEELSLKTRFLRYLSKGGVFGSFISFHVTFWKDVFTISFTIFPLEKEDFYPTFELSIHDPTRTFFKDSHSGCVKIRG